MGRGRLAKIQRFARGSVPRGKHSEHLSKIQTLNGSTWTGGINPHRRQRGGFLKDLGNFVLGRSSSSDKEAQARRKNAQMRRRKEELVRRRRARTRRDDYRYPPYRGYSSGYGGYSRRRYDQYGGSGYDNGLDPNQFGGNGYTGGANPNQFGDGLKRKRPKRGCVQEQMFRHIDKAFLVGDKLRPSNKRRRRR